jgi:hypothetical protein
MVGILLGIASKVCARGGISVSDARLGGPKSKGQRQAMAGHESGFPGDWSRAFVDRAIALP